jgi:ribosomal protein L16/L10AE
MPPILFRPPKPIQIRTPHGEIPRMSNPEIQMGKTLVAMQSLRITADQLDAARKTMRRILGKQREFRVNVHATFPVCKRPQGTKRGQGRGPIDHHVARVAAGKPIIHIPALTPTIGGHQVPVNWWAFRTVACGLPSKFQFRDQSNSFEFDRINCSLPARLQKRKWTSN